MSEAPAESSPAEAAEGDGTPTKRGKQVRLAEPADNGGSNTIKVCVRVRPFNEMEKSERAETCVAIPTRDTVIVTNPAKKEEKRYTFDRAYWSVDDSKGNMATQQTLMDEIGSDLTNNVLEGYNSCLFAYGQTGSGKTFSVLGGKTPETRGLMPRIIEDVLLKIDEIKSRNNGEDETTFTSMCSYLEIYNECIRDLLVPQDSQKKLEVRHSPSIGAYIPGLKSEHVVEWKQAEALLNFGVTTRAVSSTAMNDASSRSHCIFTMEIVQERQCGGKCTELRSKVNFVDLAGSERQKKTKATGQTAKEGIMINKSLSMLAQVISKLAEMSSKKKMDPKSVGFRNSKLTFILMDSLSGNSKTVMLAALSPASINCDETISTLVFASSVKQIETKATKNETTENFLLAELEKECERLRKQLTENVGGDAGVQKKELEELEDLTKRYGMNYKEKLEEAQNQQDQREKLLKDAGLTSREMSQALNLDKMTPQLINLHYDPALAGCLVYFLAKGEKVDVGSSKSCKIRLTGLGMQPKMAVIENKENNLTIECVRGRVLLNGAPLEGIATMRSNDRLIFGHSFAFSINIPSEDSKESSDDDDEDDEEGFQEAPPPSEHSRATKARPTIIRALEEVRSERSNAFEQCVFKVQELRMQIGEVRAKAFIRHFRKVCALVEKANDMTSELRPADRLEFSAEVLTDFFSSANSRPEVVVRLRKLETGCARWQSFVRTKIMKKGPNRWQETLSDMTYPMSKGSKGSRTVLLLSIEAFQERLAQISDIYEVSRMADADALDFSRPQNDPWREVQPWVVGELLQPDDLSASPPVSPRRSRTASSCRSAASSHGSESEFRVKDDITGFPEELSAAASEKDKQLYRRLRRSMQEASNHARETPSAAQGRGSVSATSGKRASMKGGTDDIVQNLLIVADRQRTAESMSLKKHLQNYEEQERRHTEKYQALHSEMWTTMAEEARCFNTLQAELRGEATRLAERLKSSSGGSNRGNVASLQNEVHELQTALARSQERERRATAEVGQYMESMASSRHALELVEYEMRGWRFQEQAEVRRGR